MKAGALRHRIRIERPVPTRNEFGEEIRTWVLVAERWASIDPLSGRELWAARQVQAETSHRIRTRHVDGVTTEMRIAHDGRHFDIQSALNKGERGIELEILAVERH
jgi:SPP1 family predicted phage head-tail adaptor